MFTVMELVEFCFTSIRYYYSTSLLLMLQALDSNDVLDLNQKRRSSNKLVIISDDEGDGEQSVDKDVCSKAGKCSDDSFSTGPQHTGLSVVLASIEF